MNETRFSQEFGQTEIADDPERARSYSQHLIALAEREFEHRRQLGQGESADVWFGTSPEFKKDMCFKTIRTNGDEKNSLSTQFNLHEQFRQTGVHVPRLIAHVSGSDEGAFGPQGFLAMEAVPGRTLEEEILYRRENQKKFSSEEMMSIIRESDRQIKLAHQNRLYHRDLHLNNIMYTPDGQLVFIDFGKAYRALGNDDELSIYRVSGVTNGQFMQKRFVDDNGLTQRFGARVREFGLLDEPAR